MLDPPLALNPVPAADTVAILRFALPVFVRVTSCAVEVPTVTFPKLTLVELGVSAGVAATKSDALIEAPAPLDAPVSLEDPVLPDDPPVVALLPNELGFPL
jgi:hypothetical protein